MRIACFEIENYKSHEKTSADGLGGMVVFVGRNSSGKTSIFEIFNYIKSLNSQMDGERLREIVHGGVNENGKKSIKIQIKVQIPDDLREDYLKHFLGISDDKVKEFLPTDILSEAEIEFLLDVPGKARPIGFPHFYLRIGKFTVTDTTRQEVILQHDYQANSNIILPNIGYIDSPTIHPSTEAQLNEILFNKSRQGRITINPTSYLQGQTIFLQTRIVQEIVKRLRLVEPMRESQKQVNINVTQTLDQRGASLVQLMHTFFNNNNDRFHEIVMLCKKIFPDIENIRPEMLPNNIVRILIKKRLLRKEIDLAQEGSGIDQLLILIWMIATGERGTIWLLDEPELHLHPGAQKLLYDFLRQESKNGKQIFIATHSLIFIHNSSAEEVHILIDENGKTRMSKMRDLIPDEARNSADEVGYIRKAVYDALEYEPYYSLEQNTVIVVESSVDHEVLETFYSYYLGKQLDPRRIRIIEGGDKGMIVKYGPIALYSLSGKNVILIVDNDKRGAVRTRDDIKKSIESFKQKARITKDIIKDDDFFLYPADVCSIEYYLLEARAIVEAVGDTGGDKDEKIESIEKKIETALSLQRSGPFRPKSFLKNLWSEEFGQYYNEVETPKDIAKYISKPYLEKQRELIELIERIDGRKT